MLDLVPIDSEKNVLKNFGPNLPWARIYPETCSKVRLAGFNIDIGNGISSIPNIGRSGQSWKPSTLVSLSCVRDRRPLRDLRASLEVILGSIRTHF